MILQEACAAASRLKTARCWVEVDLDVVASNYRRVRDICGPGVAVLPVLKANAYGLGATRLSRALSEEGARLFCVAELNEALEVQAASGCDALILGMTAPEQMEAALRAGVVMTVYDRDQAVMLSDTARRLGMPARVHVKIDTGLHRLGLESTNLDDILAVFGLPGLHIEGLYTHLALRDDAGDAAQIANLETVTGALRAAGLDCGLLHVSDSIGMVRHPDYRFGGVRIGAWLYGVVPNRYPNRDSECRLPVRFMARVAQLHRVAAGEYIGYDEEHPLERERLIATLSIGYADGYPRVNSAGEVTIRGGRAPVVGLVCMDQMMVDVTDIPGVVPGDPVTLLGDGITLNEYSAWTGCHRNDLLSRIGRRVKRVYVRSGVEENESIGEWDYEDVETKTASQGRYHRAGGHLRRDARRRDAV